MNAAGSPLFSESSAPLIGGNIRPVPENLTAHLVPAHWVVHEWTDYWYVDHAATEVWIGSTQAEQCPPASGHYRIRFENQLGLATIRAHDDSGKTGAPLHVEVIARKFRSPRESIDFLRHTLAALVTRLSSSPFVLGASTERLVRESQTPPNALFTYYFFRHHGSDLVRAVQGVLGRPHQRLTADPELVRPHQVRRIDRESMIRMLQAGRSVEPAAVGQAGRFTPLERLRPERVWQQIPTETFDTPENRFVLDVCRRMLGAITGLKRQGWYHGREVSPATRTRIDEAAEHLGMLTMDHRFAPLAPMVVTPAQSRVLQHKDGYRELARLWQMFQRSREPIFEQMQNAIDLRNVADLYELWLLFELIDEVAEITGEEPVPVPVVDVFGIPAQRYQVRFGAHGTLHYNRPMSTYSSIPLRPDYLWEPSNGSRVVLDAKFRMRRPAVFLGEVSEDPETIDSADKAWATSDDLTKMHAYRDALPRVRAAVVLYPGTESVFRDVDRGRQRLSLAELIEGGWRGVGAIPIVPTGITVNQDDGIEGIADE